MAKGTYINFVTPKGVARFPKLDQPDTKGEYADNKYKTEIVLSEADTKAFKAKALEAAKQLLPGVKNPRIPIKVKETKDGETVTSFIFKRHADKGKPALFDAKRAPVNVKVGGGSVIKVGGSFAAYEKGANKGITAYLDAVQIIELKEGFDARSMFSDEDGFEASESFQDETSGDEQSSDALDL